MRAPIWARVSRRPVPSRQPTGRRPAESDFRTGVRAPLTTYGVWSREAPVSEAQRREGRDVERDASGRVEHEPRGGAHPLRGEQRRSGRERKRDLEAWASGVEDPSPKGRLDVLLGKARVEHANLPQSHGACGDDAGSVASTVTRGGVSSTGLAVGLFLCTASGVELGRERWRVVERSASDCPRSGFSFAQGARKVRGPFVSVRIEHANLPQSVFSTNAEARPRGRSCSRRLRRLPFAADGCHVRDVRRVIADYQPATVIRRPVDDPCRPVARGVGLEGEACCIRVGWARWYERSVYAST
jgi:hypothetical protein